LDRARLSAGAFNAKLKQLLQLLLSQGTTVCHRLRRRATILVMEIGVAPGIRITLNADNEPLCRGASLEEALPHAEEKATSVNAMQRDFILRWIEAAKRKLEIDDLDARVDTAYKKEFAAGEKHAKKLPDFLRKTAEDFMRERIRNRLKPR
jgi:hypothetical protein